MAALEDAIKAVVDAVDALESVVPVTVVEADPLRTAVEGVLVGEGWTSPAAPEVETPAEDSAEPTGEEVTAAAEAA